FGTGYENDSAEKTFWWYLTMCFVGPRQTEYASTHGTMQAMITTHEMSSTKARNVQPKNVIAPSFAKFSSTGRPAKPKTTASAPTTPASVPRIASGDSASGSTSRTSAHTAGITTSASHATSYQSRAPGRCDTAA